MLSSTERTLVKDRKKNTSYQERKSEHTSSSYRQYLIARTAYLPILDLTQNRAAPPFTLQNFPVAKVLVPSSFQTPSPAQSRSSKLSRALFLHTVSRQTSLKPSLK
ncbi:unnamed protein product [Tuber melanosporum]|uniref:(Perigord truffle) hypothetical protein n=1 Tax=Tuber melanosporum (strain Mel28) TaxID=656061 RepID=D5GJW8_TUBMM|nr:uncharacterized protein GSTUM_00009247001 [Tuber melanosporum]CAZ84811.1 unnamed protein product [Tuber melanosporum]